MPTELSLPARSGHMVEAPLRRGVPFWRRWRGRLARLVVLACCLYIATLLVLLVLEDRFLFPGATIGVPWCGPPDYLGVRELTLRSATGDAIHAWFSAPEKQKGTRTFALRFRG